MSTRHSAARRVTVAGTLVAGMLTLVAGPAHAIPTEGTPDPTRCERLLTRAVEWPGRGSDNTLFVSDGFVSYLSAQPDCAGPAL